MNKELSRHDIRVMAVQALFPLDFNEDLSRKDAIEQAIELEHGEMIDEEQEKFIPEYLDILVTGVCEHKVELYQLIETHLKKGWHLSRLSKMDVIVLKIALFEMMYIEEVPGKVAVNEAIELTKTFSDDQSRKFVNGILSNILKELDEANKEK